MFLSLYSNPLLRTSVEEEGDWNMFCKKCGADIGDAKFCPKCGEPSGDAPAAPTGPAPAPVYQGKTVNKIAYALIAIFLGCIGIHRFYAGKWLSGIMYLLFFWTGIPWILGIIEGIVAITRDDDGYGNIPVENGKYFV